jgi:hypothetical protein
MHANVRSKYGLHIIRAASEFEVAKKKSTAHASQTNLKADVPQQIHRCFGNVSQLLCLIKDSWKFFGCLSLHYVYIAKHV